MGKEIRVTCCCANVYQGPEDREQQTVFEWAKYMSVKFPELELLHAIPNGGYRNKATAARLKLTGVKPGVPDICLPVARKGYHGLYIELKRADGGRPTDNQKWWIARLEEQGYRAVVLHGCDAALNEIADYLDIELR